MNLCENLLAVIVLSIESGDKATEMQIYILFCTAMTLAKYSIKNKSEVTKVYV